MLKIKAWKDAASIILCARQNKQLNKKYPSITNDYKLLCMKRHRNSSFMPNYYVFPGGVVEPSDSNLKWNNLYLKFGFDNKSFMSLFPITKKRPEIFNTNNNELPKEISLRITAIRETFEECDCFNEMMINWQKKVHNDSTEFYKMCDKLECYPDLWALHEWSNWLTPTTYKNKRFNTIFFMACMEKQPNARFDPAEMEDLQWYYPQDLKNPKNNITIPPPQQYEIEKICKFESLDNLLNFAVDRSKIGSSLNMPVRAKLSDGSVYLLPGDSLYPQVVSLTETLELDRSNMTINEFRNLADVKNRVELYEFEVKKVISDNF